MQKYILFYKENKTYHSLNNKISFPDDNDGYSNRNIAFTKRSLFPKLSDLGEHDSLTSLLEAKEWINHPNKSNFYIFFITVEKILGITKLSFHKENFTNLFGNIGLSHNNLNELKEIASKGCLFQLVDENSINPNTLTLKDYELSAKACLLSGNDVSITSGDYETSIENGITYYLFGDTEIDEGRDLPSIRDEYSYNLEMHHEVGTSQYKVVYYTKIDPLKKAYMVYMGGSNSANPTFHEVE